MNPQVTREILLPFFTAIGVIIGGSLIGSLSAFLTRGSPLEAMASLARSVKLWAVLVGIGGTFPTIQIIEASIFGGQYVVLARQLMIMVSAFVGANVGYWIVITLAGGE